MAFLDLFDQVVVTEFVRREMDALVRSAGGGEDRNTQILPRIMATKPVQGRHVRVRFQDILGVGLAQLKAPGAAPQLWTHKPNLRETWMELVDIDEFHRIDPIDMLQLKSPDPNVIREAQWGLAERATAMATRNDARKTWMGWEALKGVLTAPFPNSASLVINYGIPVGHFPTFATPWTTLATSDPIEDLWTLGAITIPNSGIYLGHHHMSFLTQRNMLRSTKLNDRLSSYGRDIMFPTEKDVNELLRDGSRITVTDDGYMTENSVAKTLVKWIPDGKIFTTTPDYRYAGRPIAWCADGWVLVGGPNDSQQPVAKQGMQSEWVYNRIGQQTLFRQARAVMPILNAPEAIAWATAHA